LTTSTDPHPGNGQKGGIERREKRRKRLHAQKGTFCLGKDTIRWETNRLKSEKGPLSRGIGKGL